MLGKLFQTPDDWSLHNPLKGWTLHGLSLREARLVISTLSLPESKVVIAWTPPQASWFDLQHADAAVLLEKEPMPSPSAPPFPKAAEDEEITAVRVQQVARTQEREFDRVAQELPAEILLGTQRFKTTTENFSEGGMKFRDRLPAWVAGYFTVILTANHRQFEITCMLVEDQKDEKTRVAAVETEDEESHLPAYRDWVRDFFR